MTERKKKKAGLGLLGLCLIFLAVPGVNIYDILPDFIAYFIFAASLSYPAERAPYFAEARSAFTKLGIVTLIKLPASMALTFIHSSNVADSDARSLFAITFCTVELILIFTAVSNLFSGFAYLGQRTDYSEFISAYPLGKRGNKTASVDGVKRLTYAFAVLRCVSYLLPELLLLTRGVSAEEYFTTFNIAKLYPYAVVLSLIVNLVFGIIWYKRLAPYLRRLHSEKMTRLASDALMDEGRLLELEEKTRIRKFKLALTLTAAAAILSIELRLENLHSVDLFPPFISALIFLLAMARLGGYSIMTRLAVGTGALYTLTAFISYLYDLAFFGEYTLSDISIFPAAKEQYLKLVIARAFESITFIIMMVSFTLILISFIYAHTGISPRSKKYSRQDSDFHHKLTTFAYIFGGLGILSQLARLADCVFKYFSKNLLVSVDTSTGMVAEGLVPWFGLIVIILEIAYVLFSLYAVSCFKDEVEMKYSENY